MTTSLAPDRPGAATRAVDPAAKAAAGRCLDWLLRTDATPFAGEPSCGLEAVALAGLAGRLAPARRRDVRGFVRPIVDRLPDDAWQRCDLLPALVAAVVATDGDPATPTAGRYLQAVSEIDRSQAAAGSSALLALAFDGDEATPANTGPFVDTGLASTLDRAHPEAAASLAGIVERVSRFGTRAVVAGGALPILIQGAAMACLRRYDLLIGMRLLRAANYLQCAPSTASRSGLVFVRALQREDGGFGDFAAETPRPGAAPAVIRFRLDVAVAFSALWTLAELERAGTRPVAALLGATSRRGGREC